MSAELDAILDELNAVGIKPTVEHGGKHFKIQWQHHGHMRTQTAAVTPSDWRGVHNARADVRRTLRTDGILAADTAPVVIELPRLTLRAGKPVVSSLDVAKHFDKLHKDVLRAIDKIIEDVGPDFTERNFTLSGYADPTGRKLRAFDLTRDGFSFLVMGFTGAAAAKWKVAYIDAFNAMEAELFRPPEVIVDPTLPARLAKLEDDLNALIDLSLDAKPRATRREQFIRPSVRRRLLRMGAAA